MPAGSYYKATPSVRSRLPPAGTFQYRKAARARQYLAHRDASCCWSGPTPHALSAWIEGRTTQANLSSVRLGLRRFPMCMYHCPASASQATDNRGYILGCRGQRPSRSAVSLAEFLLVSGRRLWLPLRSPEPNDIPQDFPLVLGRSAMVAGRLSDERPHGMWWLSAVAEGQALVPKHSRPTKC